MQNYRDRLSQPVEQHLNKREPSYRVPNSLQGNAALSSRLSALSVWDLDNGRMTSVRRTFCLFVAFDLILTFILWVIYTQLIGDNPIWSAFNKQVAQYNFKTSLFDTVMIAAARFTFLILGYALFRLRHWWVISITTTMTCVYLLGKCFLFEFNGQFFGGKNPLSYVLLIVCFVIAWLETWFLDFKVIPHEKKLLRNVSSYDSERDPLLHNYNTYESTATNDNGEFYSPQATPEGSDDETERKEPSSTSHGHSRKEGDLLKLVHEAWDAAWELFTVRDGWKLEGGKNVHEGIVQSTYIKKYGRKVFRLQGIIDYPPKMLWEEMIQGLGDSPKWNPTAIECRTLQVLEDNIDVQYNVSAEALGGLISARDFISVRKWGYREGSFVSIGCGCTHPDMPPQKKYVRGDNGPGGWMFQPIENEPDRCLFTWLVNTNLKGWLPHAVVDQGFSSVLMEYLKILRGHIEDVKQSKLEDSI
nr:sex hormone synthesis StAR3 [Sinohyriopsis cumingii]